jgi:cob(I)alamin adenosyltransferase
MNEEIKQPRVTTRRGDEGFTDLMFGTDQVYKHSTVIKLLGKLDTICSTIGVAKCLTEFKELIEFYSQLQLEIRESMNFFGTHPTKLERLKNMLELKGKELSCDYINNKVASLEKQSDLIKSFHTENGIEIYSGWTDYGNGGLNSANVQNIRALLREIEVLMWELFFSDKSNTHTKFVTFYYKDLFGENLFKNFAVYYNRLSDFLFLLGLALTNFSEEDLIILFNRLKHVE